MKASTRQSLFFFLLLLQPSSAFFDWLNGLLNGFNEHPSPHPRGEGNEGQQSLTSDQFPMYINCGSAAVETDSSGQQWQPDNFYMNGMRSSTSASSSDKDARIFQTTRKTFQWFGLIQVPLRYEIPASANVEYKVTLYFHEPFNFWLWLFGGVATMNVLLQDKLVFDDLRLFEDGPAFKALSVDTTISSTADGLIKIEVQGVNSEPLLSAIEIHLVDANTNVETPPAIIPTASPTSAPSADPPATPSTPKPNAPSATAAPISTTTTATAAPVSSTPRPPSSLQATSSPVAAPTMVSAPVADPPMQPVQQPTGAPPSTLQATSSPVAAPIMSPRDKPVTLAPVVDPAMQPVEQPTAAPVSVPTAVLPPNDGRRIFKEEGSALMMEAEHASSEIPDEWKFESELKGYAGDGYLRFDGNGVSGGSPNGVLSYFFYITNPGKYTLKLRSNKLNEDETLSNDCYTRLVGYDGYQGEFVKTFMQGPARWWSFKTEHEITHDDKKVPKYELEAGKVYELQIAGRSKGFHLDRVLVYKMAVVDRTIAEQKNFPESALFSGELSGSPPTEPSPTKSPIASPLTDSPVSTGANETPKESYGTPRFEGDWKGSKNYPLYVAEAQGAMIGKDFCVFSGFNEPDGGYDAATARNYALDTSDPNAQWRRLDDLPVSEGITHGAFVVVGTRFYMCGGYLGRHPGPHIPTCLVYDHSASSSKQWSFLPDLPDGRAGGGMVYDTNTNSLTFSGGAERPVANRADATDYTDTWTLELNNLGAGWKRKTDIPFLSNHMSCVTARDDKGKEVHIFVGGQIGENEHTGNIKDNYQYDVATDQWIKLQDMILTRGHAASSTRAIGNGFLIAGGSTNEKGRTASIHYYDIPSDTWTKIGDLPNDVNTPVCDISPGGYMYCESGYANWKYSYQRKIVVDKL